MKKLKKGILIVFEGIDGSGKTTQAQILLNKLNDRGIAAVYFREPSLGRWGREIKEKAAHADSVTPQEELDLFQKDRRENVEENLLPSLDAKKAVILDRYYFSTIAYQGAKGIDPDLIRRMNEAFAAKPDLVFILDVIPERGLERIADRGTKDVLFEREDYLIQVRRLFRSMKGENIIHIDASQSREEIAETIEKITLARLEPLLV
ncbi:MAG: dTMP kinase [Candidatus Aminicenantes bacterium]|nr:dTMP kinase [Candidatus Aminicenantes bacterium]